MQDPALSGPYGQGMTMTDRMIDTPLDDDLDLFEDGCDYDPLDEVEEKDADEKAETFGYKGSPDEVEQTAPVTKQQVPARERIERLFADMPPFKRWFITILDACRTAQAAPQIEELVNGLVRKRQCVYSAASFCTMLEEAGALEKLTVDGTPYEEVEPQLVEVEEDGKKFLRPTPPPEVMWKTTPAGLDALADDNPLGELEYIVDEQEQAYAGVFQEILGMCDGDGSSIDQIKRQVNSNPALDYPKKTAQFFMDYLDRNGAIEWDGTWKITEVGRNLLEHLEGK